MPVVGSGSPCRCAALHGTGEAQQSQVPHQRRSIYMAQRIYYENLCGNLYRVAVAESGALIYSKVKPKSGSS